MGGGVSRTKKKVDLTDPPHLKSEKKLAGPECSAVKANVDCQELDSQNLPTDKNAALQNSDVHAGGSMSTKRTLSRKETTSKSSSYTEIHKTAESANPTKPNELAANDRSDKDTPSDDKVHINTETPKPDGRGISDEKKIKIAEKALSEIVQDPSGIESRTQHNFPPLNERSPGDADKSITSNGEKVEKTPSQKDCKEEDYTGNLDDTGVGNKSVKNNLNEIKTEDHITGNGLEEEDSDESEWLKQTDSKKTDERETKAENNENSGLGQKKGIQGEEGEARKASGQGGSENEKKISVDLDNADDSNTFTTNIQGKKKTDKSEDFAGNSPTDSKEQEDKFSIQEVDGPNQDNSYNKTEGTNGANVVSQGETQGNTDGKAFQVKFPIQEVGGSNQDNSCNTTEGTNGANVVSQGETQGNTDGKAFQETQDNKVVKDDISSEATKDYEEEPKAPPTMIYEHALSDNLRFYRNEIPSRPFPGSRIEDMLEWKGDYTKLEYTHSYIQWLFPIPESSGMNYSAQALQKHEAKAIGDDNELRGKVLKAFEMMLDFYGMKLVNRETRTFDRTDDFKSRFEHLNRSIHNYFRITRILKALGELGLEDLQAPWLEFIIDEATVHNTLPRLNNSRSMDHWLEALVDPEEHWRLHQKLSDFNNNSSSHQVDGTAQDGKPEIKKQDNDIRINDTAAGKEENTDTIKTSETIKAEEETTKSNQLDETVDKAKKEDVDKTEEDTDGDQSHSEAKLSTEDPKEIFGSKPNGIDEGASAVKNCHGQNDHPIAEIEKVKSEMEHTVGNTGGITEPHKQGIERDCCDSGGSAEDEISHL